MGSYLIPTVWTSEVTVGTLHPLAFGRNQGLPRRRRQGQEVDDGDLLGSRHQSLENLQPMGLLRVRRCISDCRRLCEESSRPARPDDRGPTEVATSVPGKTAKGMMAAEGLSSSASLGRTQQGCGSKLPSNRPISKYRLADPPREPGIAWQVAPNMQRSLPISLHVLPGVPPRCHPCCR